MPLSQDQVPFENFYKKLFNLLVDQQKHMTSYQLSVMFVYNQVSTLWYSVSDLALLTTLPEDLCQIENSLLTRAGTTCFTGKPTRLSSFPITRN